LRRPRAIAVAVATAALACVGAAPPRVPALVFVSRQPLPGDPHAVPGLGPHARTAAAGGRLMVRERDGRVRPLLSDAAMFDVSDPSVSPSGEWIAFAGVQRPDSAWRIWVCRPDGAGLKGITRTRGGARGDDLDPCWVSERELCFASTRDGERAQYADVPVTQLYRVDVASGSTRRITWERNGAEEPCYDRARDRVVYARWWFNRWRPSLVDSLGVTDDPSRAIAADTVNLWQAVEVDRDGAGLRIAAGAFASRRATMAYQPAVLADGGLAAVYALNTGLWPSPGALGVQVFSRRFGTARRVAGAYLDDADEIGYGTPRGLAPPAACSPAPLPDGRLVVSLDPGGRGDFGLWVARPDADRVEPLLDLPGTDELDAAVLAPWPGRARTEEVGSEPPPATGTTGTFTYFCLNLFATGPIDGPVGAPPPLHWPLRIRFFTTHGRDAEPDSVALVRVADVAPDGSVAQSGLPAGVPLFEQLVDATGQPLLTAHGAAQVAGANFGTPGGTARCVGCHLGHSSLTVPAERGAAFDAAPIATLHASPSAAGSSPARAVDRRARGAAADVAWVAASDTQAWIRLQWPRPLALESVRVTLPTGGSVARSAWAMLRLSRGDQDVADRTLDLHAGRPARVSLDGTVADRVEIRLLSTGGGHSQPLAVAEIEIPARFAAP
jgi:hypothetical protein